jgi:pimeloyl-ACP methyl ester carboxylesterase
LEVSQTTQVLPDIAGAVCGGAQTTLECCTNRFRSKILQTGRKRDANLTHHFHQWHRDLPARAGPRPTGAALRRPTKKSGFRGGLNWYRNLDRNWELTAPWHGAQIREPSLFIAGSRDSVVTGLIGAKRIADMERVLPNLRQKFIIEGAGHWVQQERAQEVNTALIAFLRENAG